MLCEKEPAQTFEEAHEQATNLAAATGTTVIVKGGHLHGDDAGNTAVFPDGTCAHVRTRAWTAVTRTVPDAPCPPRWQPVWAWNCCSTQRLPSPPQTGS